MSGNFFFHSSTVAAQVLQDFFIEEEEYFGELQVIMPEVLIGSVLGNVNPPGLGAPP